MNCLEMYPFFQFCLLAVFHQTAVGANRRLGVHRQIRKEENLACPSSVPDWSYHAASFQERRLLFRSECNLFCGTTFSVDSI